jgi:hypothetical protein
MKVDADFTRGASRLVYPELPGPLTSADHARSPTSQVVLLVQLKVFQAVGRFLSLCTVPRLIFEHVAHRLGIDANTAAKHWSRYFRLKWIIGRVSDPTDRPI